MKNISIWKHSFLLSVAILLSGVSFAQKKYVETFSVGEDVLVSVNTSHTHVVFETWNKDIVEVEARIEGENLSEAQKKEIFDNWDFDILGNSKKVVITSHAGGSWSGMESLSGLGALKSLESLKVLEQLPEMPILKDLTTMNFDVVVPDVPDYEEMPNWPFTEERASIHYKDGYTNFNFNNNGSYVFDKSEYERNKQSYVDKLNRKYKTNVTVKQTDRWLKDVDEWAKGFEKVMEAWGEDFGAKFSNQFGPEFERKMEAWGENLGKQMEAWGEEFGKEFEKEMEAWGENFGREMEAWAEQFDEGPHGKKHNVKAYILKEKDGKKIHPEARKTIIIKMPKGGKTDINVRHGEVKMADAYNVRAKLNYAALTANSIDGGSTLINAAYAPVYINEWNDGSLDVDYVEDCKLNEVKNIVLKANSSNVQINVLDREALLQGSFGNLFINKVANNFKVVDIVLDNTNATILLPDAGFDFYFNGKKTRLLHPKSLQVNQSKNGNNVLLRGYHKSQNNSASFKIDARYSDVTLKN
ncbi:hypothetical protein [Altibacter sp. HG106]|uniref:hypothetical protein n=1 Tax=Altibacter sp. HG106 TaxID=3023937 RepID=UPI002350902C|nr:hypothetical protein [Altibacter sp. HG106]MDC7995740.1 hypothetical protein [Altibacter sp. HG106]